MESDVAISQGGRERTGRGRKGAVRNGADRNGPGRGGMWREIGPLLKGLTLGYRFAPLARYLVQLQEEPAGRYSFYSILSGPNGRRDSAILFTR